jgi:hypothetical protein
VGTVSLTTVSANGGAGGTAAPGKSNAGGAGSGGGILLHGSTITVNGINAAGGSVRLNPATYSVGDALPAVSAGVAELAPGMLKVPTGQSLGLSASPVALPGGLSLVTKDIDVNGGALTGSGPIVGNLMNEGLVSPGGPLPDHFDVSGDFTQGAAGMLRIDIGGTSPSPLQFDSISATTAYLDGALDVDLIPLLLGDPTFHPALGDIFDIIIASSIVGDFSSFTLPTLDSGLAFRHDTVNLGGSDQVAYRLYVAPTPLPPALLLFGTGLGLIGMVGWRKRRRDYAA